MSGNPFGVVIPPSKGGDCLVCGKGTLYPGRFCREHQNHPPEPPRKPHTPASAPNTPPRGSADGGDGSEALRLQLEPVLATEPQRPAQEQPVTLPPAARSLARGLAWAAAGLTIAAVALGVLWLLG